MAKGFSVRLADEHVSQLAMLASFDGVAIAEEIREAITLLLKSRSQDPSFARRVKDAYENAGKVLSGLERGQELITALGDPVAEVAAADVSATEVPRIEHKQAPVTIPVRKVARKVGAAAGRAGSRG